MIISFILKIINNCPFDKLCICDIYILAIGLHDNYLSEFKGFRVYY